MVNSKSYNDYIQKTFDSSSQLIKTSSNLTPEIIKSVNLITKSLQNGKKIVLFGNGGSAADAQHIAAEFLGRYKLKRKSIPAIALTSNSSTTTAIANDYDFSDIFSRQCESLVSSGDVVFGISTSGNSKNVELGLKTSKQKNAITIGLLGCDGGSIKDIVDIAIIVDSTDTAKIQEIHRVIYHIICNFVENKLA